MVNEQVNNTPAPGAKPIFQAMLMSDIHLEYGDVIIPVFPVLAPVLMLAGDIGRPDIPRLQNFLLAQCERFEHIFYVAGNHCFYHGEYTDRLRQLRELNNLHPRIHFLQEESYLLPNNVRILGTILWSHIPSETAGRIGQTMADYRTISIVEGEEDLGENKMKAVRQITVDDTNLWHTQQHAWLLKEIQKARHNQEHVVVITHHAPSREDTYTKVIENAGFIDAFVNDHHSDCVDPVRLWVYGHTHRAADFFINSTRVVSNPYGYTGDQCGFRPNLVTTLYDDATVTVSDS